MASSSRSDVRYHKLSVQEGEGSSGAGRRRRNSANRQTSNFTSRKRMLPKVVAVGFVFSILLLFQYGSHIFNSMTDDIERDIESIDSNLIRSNDDDKSLKPAAEGNIIAKPIPRKNDAQDNNQVSDNISAPEIPEIGDNDLQDTSSQKSSGVMEGMVLDKARGVKKSQSGSEYQLDLDHCKIPKLEVRSQNYMRYETTTIKAIKTCENEKEISVLEDGILHLNQEYPRARCCVENISRPSELSPDTYVLGECEKFNEDSQFEMGSREFVKVSCSTPANSTQKETKYFNYHANVVLSNFQSKIDYWTDKRKPFNVLILVLDSTSRTDAHRNLPKTMDYLLNKLNFVEFNGYHVLSEPTIRNAIPLLFGVDEFEFYKARAWTDYWDSMPFIWDKFSKLEYLTAYLEDMGHAGTFNYGGQKGFTKKPTDFYSRPLLVSYEEVENFKHPELVCKPEYEYCLGRKPAEEFILDYQLQILKKMNGLTPLFLMPWTCWPQHDLFGTLPHVDNLTFNFFSQIGKSDLLLENTLMILMGDHGFYHGEYAQTHEGLLERRHPVFLIRLPKALTDTHPDFLKNVQDNANVITSHYDVHKTLEHLVQVLSISNGASDNSSSAKFPNKYGQSLLLPIPKSRTCEDAGIHGSRCACNLPPPLPGENSLVEVPNTVKFEEPRQYVDRPINDKCNAKS